MPAPSGNEHQDTLETELLVIINRAMDCGLTMGQISESLSEIQALVGLTKHMLQLEANAAVKH